MFGPGVRTSPSATTATATTAPVETIGHSPLSGHGNIGGRWAIPPDGIGRDTGAPEAAFRREQPRRRLPATTVYLHLDRQTQTWSMDGVGPISRAEAADIVGHSRVTLKPVIDLAANLTYTGYVAPPRLKEQTALQNAGYCTFPSCNRTARKADFDHMSLRRPGGRTYLVTAGTTTRLDQQQHRRRTNAA